MEKPGPSRVLRAAIACVVALAAPSFARGDVLTDALVLSLTAEVTGDVYQEKQAPGERSVGSLKLDALWAPVPWGEIVGNAFLSVDSDREIDRTLNPDWREDAVQPRSLEVTELAGVGHFSSFDVTIGKLVANWGIGDLLQPTDSLTPQDLTDPLRDRRIGSSGMLVELFPGDLELDLAIVRHAPHRLPQSDHRWFPVRDLGGVELERELPSGGEAAILAARLHGTARGLDWMLTVRHGPDLAPHVGIEDGMPLLVYPDMMLAGASISAAVDRFVLRSELALRRYDRRSGGSVNEDFATILLGLERRYPALVLGTDATMIVELVRDQHVAGLELPREIAILDPARLLRTGLSAKLLTHNPTGWEAEVGIVGDLEEGGGIVQLLVRRNLGDRVDVELGVDVLIAGGNAALEPVADNDRATFRAVSHL